ncbi:hypothetical protein O9G_005527 [Rozella allomycis CSF55]|uniref:Uncharacterized protein n=1 Tax=Rozella allomycis (strain CSF55) TaxID=988480 RepID=A0A075AME5_ROZAC|nr:hypothetical protein O9G_005527 [Rozella allomycis CSF55]|eukprot:EPZ30748.1 hypothetical protein O9G_005527 [Rozella allomycis CSF55]
MSSNSSSNLPQEEQDNPKDQIEDISPNTLEKEDFPKPLDSSNLTTENTIKTDCENKNIDEENAEANTHSNVEPKSINSEQDLVTNVNENIQVPVPDDISGESNNNQCIDSQEIDQNQVLHSNDREDLNETNNEENEDIFFTAKNREMNNEGDTRENVEILQVKPKEEEIPESANHADSSLNGDDDANDGENAENIQKPEILVRSNNENTRETSCELIEESTQQEEITSLEQHNRNTELKVDKVDDDFGDDFGDFEETVEIDKFPATQEKQVSVESFPEIIPWFHPENLNNEDKIKEFILDTIDAKITLEENEDEIDDLEQERIWYQRFKYIMKERCF